ncbi:hypothetical protein ABZ362_28530 [Streptomyces sp. NPDC005951]|uniref:hypothetical protein n=1 Tax=Streptomyces sp. NPDC005951 TaxID=3154573 RepID=UPI0033C9A58C
MGDYVLVHGAMHGGWGWRFVRARAHGWDIHSVAAGHDMMLEAPETTTRLLTRITGRGEAGAPEGP